MKSSSVRFDPLSGFYALSFKGTCLRNASSLIIKIAISCLRHTMKLFCRLQASMFLTSCKMEFFKRNKLA